MINLGGVTMVSERDHVRRVNETDALNDDSNKSTAHIYYRTEHTSVIWDLCIVMNFNVQVDGRYGGHVLQQQ